MLHRFCVKHNRLVAVLLAVWHKWENCFKLISKVLHSVLDVCTDSTVWELTIFERQIVSAPPHPFLFFSSREVIQSTVKKHGNKADSQSWEWHIVIITSSLLRIIAGDVHCHRREHGACSFPWHTNSCADKGFHVHLATAHDCVHGEMDGVLGFTRVVLMDEDRMNRHFRTSWVPARHEARSTTLNWLYKVMFTNMPD